LNRKYGLTIDNLLSVDMVLSNGGFCNCEYRGKSRPVFGCSRRRGNFGVIISFKYQLHPVNNVVGGPMLWPLEQATVYVIKFFRDYVPERIERYWRTNFCTDLSDQAIEQQFSYSEVPTMHIYPVNGAVKRVGDKDTPWPNRSSNFVVAVVGVDPDPSNADLITNWQRIMVIPYSH
jgi:FAD/FMN-containing dehydrogenase